MNLELYPLKVFCQVMADGTFSAAAKNLRITQPNVSQQISKLEARLNQKLFQRVGHDVVPTSLARELRDFALPLLDQVHAFEDRVVQGRSSPKGLVRYAMPESCQWTPHYRKIMSQISAFPEVQFQIGILTNEETVRRLLEGSLDFGFIVGEKLAPELRFEKFSDEAYSAVASDQRLFGAFDSKRELASLRLITYPGWEQFFTTWAKGMGIWDAVRGRLPEAAVRIETLAGAIHAVQEGAGTAIIPTHCVLGELSSGALQEWKGKSRRPSNPVYLARRVGEKLPRRAELVIEMLRTAKAELG